MISTPLLLEQGLVEGDFIDRFADASLADNDHFGPENLRHLRVREVEDRPDARVAGALAQDEILLPSDAVEGFADFSDQGFVVRGLEVFAGEIGFDRDGTHVRPTGS